MEFKLTFVRHAESIGNVLDSNERANSLIANHDYWLTPTGIRQSWITGLHLKSIWNKKLPDLFFCSNFKRTQMTMDVILDQLGVTTIKPTTDFRLDEKWDGIFHELTKEEIERLYPEQVRLRKKAGYYHHRPPGGENCPDVEMRILSFISEHILSGKHVFIVGHGRWFIILQKIFHKLTVGQFLELKERDDCPNCSITEYGFDIPANPPESITPWLGQITEQKTEFA